jgi:protein-tyrosine phosphatase
MTLTITERELRLEVAYNVRHLGGYRTQDGRTTADVVVRSAGLQRLTDAGLRSLADAGVRTIIDLRSTVERERDVTPNPASVGIRHVFAPVFEQDQSPVGQSTEEFPGYALVYRRMLETGRNAYRTLFEFASEADGSVLFHCAAGKDRTGVAAALMLSLAGVDEETVVDDYALSATLLEPLMQEWLPKMAERGISEERGRKLMASPPEDMCSTLEHIRNLYGGPEGYLESVGVSPAVISAVRARMVA